jgi:hypothetical protein
VEPHRFSGLRDLATRLGQRTSSLPTLCSHVQIEKERKLLIMENLERKLLILENLERKLLIFG